jgi:hypothetical protein
VTACHWFLVGGPADRDRTSGVGVPMLSPRRFRPGQDHCPESLTARSYNVPPQRIERYHRAQLMSINFVPGHARSTGPVLVWTVVSFSALLWSLQSKLKI